jgi:uncharacterized SAM-binding protein YcdF (DUF218 family)
MKSDHREFPVVVVPEGLAFDEHHGKTLHAPSFLIPPANSFGGPFPEHEVMAAWLKARGCPDIQTPSLTFSRYIDTWGNAVELRAWLDRRGQWPLGPIVIVAAFRHTRRVRLCFLRNGYVIARVDTVSYTVREQSIVPRLFYYRWPLLHKTRLPPSYGTGSVRQQPLIP